MLFHKQSLRYITITLVNLTICFFAFFYKIEQSQAVTKIECTTNFPCEDDLKPKIEFWVKVFQEYTKNQAIFHDAEAPEVVYSVLTSDAYCHQSRASSTVNQERTRIKNLIRSIQDKLAAGTTFSSEEQEIYRTMRASKTFELDKALDRIRCQNGVRDQFEAALSRYRYYKNDVVQILKEANLPEEIQYLPFVESSYNPLAYSKVGAAGLWQIMPRTARVLGLKINASIDERLDPILATRAAARYFENSYETLFQVANQRGHNTNILGPFVITSYNYGIAGMKNAVTAHGVDFMDMLNNYKGKSFRVAVKNFYASFLAAKHIVTNEEKYFRNVSAYEHPKYTTMNVPKSISATKFSQTFNIPLDTLRELNPVLTKRVWAGVHPIPQNFTLKIPSDVSGDNISKQIAALSSDDIEVKIKNYQVQRGDVVCGIARSFDVSCSELMAVNGLTGKAVIRAGQILSIPSKETKIAAVKPAPKAPTSPTSTQQSILVLEDTPSAPEKTAPDAPAPPIPTSQAPVVETPPQPVVASIIAPPPVVIPPQPIPDNQPVVAGSGSAIPNNNDWLLVLKTNAPPYKYFIRVEADETLGHYSDWIEGSTTQSLRDLNNFSYNKALSVGQKIFLPLENDDQKGSFEKKRIEYHQTLEEGFEERYNVIATTTYQVKRGDNEWSISDKLQIPLWLIKKYNPTLVQKSMRIGDILTVPLLKEKVAAEAGPAQDLPVPNS